MLPPTLQDAPVLLQAARFEVREVDLSHRSTQATKRQVVVPHDAVLIVPVLGDGRIVLIQNQRFAVGQTLWELPAGTLESPPSRALCARTGLTEAGSPAGESPADCAARELVEETGYRAGRLSKLTEFFTCPGFCTELMHVFLAEDLTQVGQRLDDTERITVHVKNPEETIQMVRAGVIRDAKTIAGLLFFLSLTKDQR